MWEFESGSNYKKEKIYEAFVNNQELICKNNIVSKELAYEFDKSKDISSKIDSFDSSKPRLFVVILSFNF